MISYRRNLLRIYRFWFGVKVYVSDRLCRRMQRSYVRLLLCVLSRLQYTHWRFVSDPNVNRNRNGRRVGRKRYILILFDRRTEKSAETDSRIGTTQSWMCESVNSWSKEHHRRRAPFRVLGFQTDRARRRKIIDVGPRGSCKPCGSGSAVVYGARKEKKEGVYCLARDNIYRHVVPPRYRIISVYLSFFPFFFSFSTSWYFRFYTRMRRVYFCAYVAWFKHSTWYV